MQYSYIQLSKRLTHDIRRQRYQIGDRLPSVRVYAQTQGVSISTVMRCYRYMESEGYVEIRVKSGAYVADWKAQKRAQLACNVVVHAVTQTAVQYEQLASLQHRMTQLHALTAQPLSLALHLAHAVPQWYPCDAMNRIAQRVLRRDPNGFGAHSTGGGHPALKEALKGHLARCGVDLATQDLLVTSGATEALQLALRAVTRPGDTVAVESPVYFGLLQMVEHLGLKVLEIPCIPGQGISLEALEYALEQHGRVRAVVAMPTFQNPLGTSLSDTAKRRLLGIVERHDMVLIEDDVFGDLASATDRPLPLKAWDRAGRVIYCGSCSKSLAPAMRLGWIAGGRHQRQLESLKLSSSLTTPVFEQGVLAEFMTSGALPSHLRKLRERLVATVEPAKQAVSQHFPLETHVGGPPGGWWLWIALPEPLDTMVVLREAVRRGIAFTPGALFSTTGKYAHHLRLNIARPWDRELEEGIKTLGLLIKAHQ